MDNSKQQNCLLDEEVDAWMLLDHSSEGGLVLQITESDAPSDLDSDSSSIVVVEESVISQSTEDSFDEPAACEKTPADVQTTDGQPEGPQTDRTENELSEEPGDLGELEQEDAIQQAEEDNSEDSEEYDSDNGDPEEDLTVEEESLAEELQFKPPPDLLEVANRVDELDELDLSLTQQDLPAELNLAGLRRTRHYIHHRNSRLNVVLNFVVAFTVAAVLGFGLGHFIGLSDNFPPRPGCSSPLDESHHSMETTSYEHLSEAELRAELQRTTAENHQLRQSLESKNQYCTTDRHESLARENEDLKSTIGRIRYGRPVRSYEDRDTINRLETENQELRELVGKLRYSCKGADGEPYNFLAWNVTDLWNKYIKETTNHLNASQAVKEQLDRLKQSTVDIIRVVENRWVQLQNLTKQLKSPELASVVTQSFSESLDSFISIGTKFLSQEHETASRAVNDFTKKMGDVFVNLEKGWNDVTKNFGGEQKTEKRKSSINEDWFTEMGKGREAARSKEKKSDWIFSRARGRGNERQKKIDSSKRREAKTKHKSRSSKY